MRRLSFSLLLVAALALGACGGSDNKNNASTTTPTTSQGTTGTSGTTGATKGKSGKGGSKKNRSPKKSSGTKSGGSGATKTTPSPSTTTTPSQGTTPTPANITPRKTAQTVCGQFLPEAVRRELKRGKTTKKQIAKNYSKPYPKDQRSDAYKGCLAGLKKIH